MQVRCEGQKRNAAGGAVQQVSGRVAVLQPDPAACGGGGEGPEIVAEV